MQGELWFGFGGPTPAQSIGLCWVSWTMQEVSPDFPAISLDLQPDLNSDHFWPRGSASSHPFNGQHFPWQQILFGLVEGMKGSRTTDQLLASHLGLPSVGLFLPGPSPSNRQSRLTGLYEGATPTHPGAHIPPSSEGELEHDPFPPTLGQ